MADRRSPSAPPSPWTPQLFVSLAVTLGGIVWSNGRQTEKMDTVNANVSDVKERLKSLEASNNSYDKTAMSLTKDQTEIVRRIEKLENDMATQQKAYNYDISKRLAIVEAKTGIEPKSP